MRYYIMKKVTSFVFILLTLLTVLGITVFSCKLKIEDEELYDKPGVRTVNNDRVMVTIPKMSSDTEHINIYRRDKANNNVVTIGLLYHPEALENDNKNYIFEDTLVLKSHKYDYRARYKISGKYYKTEWSSSVTVSDGIPATQTIKYTTSGARLIYSRDSSHTLTIDGTITPPSFTGFSTGGYVPMLIVEGGGKSQTIRLGSTITSGTVISLPNILPPSFKNKNIKIKGIVGQTEFPRNGTTKGIKWTEPASIDVVNAGSDRILNIPTNTSGDGTDY